MRRRVGLAWMLAFACVASLSDTGFPQESKTEDVLQTPVASLGGDLRVWRSASRKVEKLATSATVSAEDRIGTANKGTSRLGVRSDVIVTLKGVDAGPEEGLSILSRKKSVQLKLFRGRILVESFDVQVAVDTPAGRAEGKSVTLMVEATEEGTRIVPIEGQLKVTNSLGGLDAGPGETVVLKKVAAPSKKRAPGAEADLSWTSEVDGPANLIKNPGFEEGSKDWLILLCNNKPLARIDGAAPRSGRKCVRIDIPNHPLIDLPADSTRDQTNCALYQAYPTPPPGRYLLRFWLRTVNYTANGKEIPVTIGLSNRRLECPRAAGEWRRACFIVDVLAGEGPRLNIPINPTNSKETRLNGTIWIDDFALIPVGPVPPAKDSK